jgi:hypothetical protein
MEGVWDQQQSISKWTAADGLAHEYVRNTMDGVIVSNTDTACTVAGVMPQVTTILRDSTGGGWWDQREVRALAARRPTPQRIIRRAAGKPLSADIRLCA